MQGLQGAVVATSKRGHRGEQRSSILVIMLRGATAYGAMPHVLAGRVEVLLLWLFRYQQSMIHALGGQCRWLLLIVCGMPSNVDQRMAQWMSWAGAGGCRLPVAGLISS